MSQTFLPTSKPDGGSDLADRANVGVTLDRAFMERLRNSVSIFECGCGRRWRETFSQSQYEAHLATEEHRDGVAARQS
ncbi:hypothetical protein [Nakamurella endophytica]|uniref:Uncharacterized protein n=1 Tax=Nakamurella endophytica TaxID=1748367 RepID=A0A917WNS8_9ACTN|nr:hypothetical protein [Nakamurella endophytica]GGM17820.1 hypothetical protein GCM10011594_42430 [Nakamurella endophytica]